MKKPIEWGGAIAEFDTVVNKQVNALFPEYLDGKIGDEFLESAILLGEAVRKEVGSRPLLEAQKRRLDWAIQIGELTEQGFFGERGEEIFGRAQETLQESGIILDETSSSQEPVTSQVVVGLFPPSPAPIWRAEVDVVSSPPPSETELKDQIEFVVAPIADRGMRNNASTHQISKAKLSEESVLPDGQQVNDLEERGIRLLNLLLSVPFGMGTFKKSMEAALGLSEPSFNTTIASVRSILERQNSNYGIYNASSRRSLEALYHLGKIEQMAGLQDQQGTEGMKMQKPPASGNGEVGIKEPEREVNGAELGDEEAVRKIEDLLEQNLAYLDSRGLTARDILLDRLPEIDSHELELLNKYDRDEIELLAERLSTVHHNVNVDFNRVPLRVVQHLRFAADFWTGSLQRYNPEFQEIKYDRFREIVRDYLHLETLYSRAYPEAENLPLLTADLAQKVRERVSKKK